MNLLVAIYYKINSQLLRALASISFTLCIHFLSSPKKILNLVFLSCYNKTDLKFSHLLNTVTFTFTIHLMLEVVQVSSRIKDEKMNDF